MNPERREAFLAANWSERVAIHQQVAARKAAALDARRALGRRYLSEHPEGITIPWEQGWARIDLPELTQSARDEALELALDRDAQANNRALEFPVLGRDFTADSPALKLATNPVLLSPLVRYFQMLPVLFNMFVTRAHTTELLEDSAHRFHLDPEDVVTHKVFIHLTDVDEDCGPFHVLSASATERVLDAVDYRRIARVSDEQIREFGLWGDVTRFTGPAGTVIFADSSRCLHFGGRPRKAGKPLRYMLVIQYLLPTSFLFPIAGDADEPRHLPTLAPTGDELWDALIGARHT